MWQLGREEASPDRKAFRLTRREADAITLQRVQIFRAESLGGMMYSSERHSSLRN
jgi:hypothetical protein